MRRLPTTLIAAAGLAATVTAVSAAPVVFKGKAVIESLSTQCNSASPTKGRFYTANPGQGLLIEYRPEHLGTNGASTHMCVQGETDTSAWLECSEFEVAIGTFQPATALHIALQDSTPILNYTAKVRVLAQKPATLTNKTKFVTLRAQIRDIGNIAGCTVTFHAALVR